MHPELEHGVASSCISYQGVSGKFGVIPAPLNVPLSPLDGIWGSLKGSWRVLVLGSILACTAFCTIAIQMASLPQAPPGREVTMRRRTCCFRWATVYTPSRWMLKEVHKAFGVDPCCATDRQAGQDSILCRLSGGDHLFNLATTNLHLGVGVVKGLGSGSSTLSTQGSAQTLEKKRCASQAWWSLRTTNCLPYHTLYVVLREAVQFYIQGALEGENLHLTRVFAPS